MPHRQLPSLDIDLSSERDDTLDAFDPEPEPLPEAADAADVVLTGVRLSTVDWFVLALRAWIGVLAATLVVAPLIAGVALGLIVLVRVAWAALGA